MSKAQSKKEWSMDDPAIFLNREVSWLAFAKRVLALVEDNEVPLLERMKFAGIMGMLHDEFFMKRMSGLKRQMKKKPHKLSLDGRTPAEEFAVCRQELIDQTEILTRTIEDQLRPALKKAGIPILNYDELTSAQRKELRGYFQKSVQPILTPLAVDAEHPFPFISNLGLNLAVIIPDDNNGRERFIRIKVPDNRPRWVPIPDASGFVPLEQVIAANLDMMFPVPPRKVFQFRVTRAAEGSPERQELEPEDPLRSPPGVIVRQVSDELKARKFAGVVRLEVDSSIPKRRLKWLIGQLAVTTDDVYPLPSLGRNNDLIQFDVSGFDDLRVSPHTPVTQKRLRGLNGSGTSSIFEEIRRGDILLHHPYDSFDTSVLAFLESAALDSAVLAIKLTIYRTSSQSPIIQALIEAARRGKQVAVLVEITARFDEAPNIAWGKLLEEEGVHVSYGVERLKTHVKLALVIREEDGLIRRYLHVGTGNYHTGTARIYEDVGLLTCHEELCADAAAVFNTLTGGTLHGDYHKLIVAPVTMREQFTELIRAEADNASHGRPSGIRVKMNQLQDPDMIRELYKASQAGVPITLYVRGLCCLRPGVADLSETIRVVAVVDRFLEHSRVYEFTNGGDFKYYIGSGDWMKRNIDRRVETIAPVLDPNVGKHLGEILDVYDNDNCSAWDGLPDGTYKRRRPAEGEPRRAVQSELIERALRRRELPDDQDIGPLDIRSATSD